MKPLCIYHGGCDDGFGAALAVHLAFNGEVELFPGAYHQPPPADDVLRDRAVIFVDFCYQRDVMDHVASVAETVLVLDHHKTAEENLRGVPVAHGDWAAHRARADRMECVFDMKRSGAMLAWDYFHRTPAPQFFRYLQDRDLWLQELPHGTEFTMALRSHPQDIALWRKFSVEHLIDEGRDIVRYYRQRIEELKLTAVPRTLGGHTVPTCNAPYFAASEVAGELAPAGSFAACYFFNGKAWQFSLRSRDGFDVGAFARQFGGGGHVAAAGFSVPFLPWQRPVEFPEAELGWLLEGPGLIYWAGREKGLDTWSQDSLRAVRFARKHDAELAIKSLDLQNAGARAVQHAWRGGGT